MGFVYLINDIISLFDFTDLTEITGLSLISATFDSSGEEYLVNPLVNERYIAQVAISTTKEPFVKQLALLYDEDGLGSNGISHYKQSNKLIYLISEQLVLCIFSSIFISIFYVKIFAKRIKYF